MIQITHVNIITRYTITMVYPCLASQPPLRILKRMTNNRYNFIRITTTDIQQGSIALGIKCSFSNANKNSEFFPIMPTDKHILIQL